MNKLFLKIIFFNSILFFNLFAQVNLNLPQSSIQGEPFIFEIEVQGSDIKFPTLDYINGNLVKELSNSSYINIYNSKKINMIKKTYVFYPKEDFVFPKLEFMIDNKQYYTSEKKIVLTKAVKSNFDTIDLSIKSSKSDLYIGEKFILTIVLKYKKASQIVDLSLGKLDFGDFWYKQIDDSLEYDKDDFKIHELKFLLSPLKKGDLKISPIYINAQIIELSTDRFSLYSPTSKNIKVYSNELNFKVNSLPDNLKLIGEFDIDAQIDKEKINQGENISYKLKIHGVGNIDDIPDIKLEIKDALIYENKPIITTKLVKDEYVGTYEKVFSILPQKSILIEPITINYFSKEDKQTKKISTQSYDIEVFKDESLVKEKNELQKQAEKIEVIKIVEKTSQIDRIIFFILGNIVTLITILIYFYYIKKKKTNEEYNTPLILKVKKSKSKKELLRIMAVYINKDKKLDEMIFVLEKEENFLTIKKEIIKKIKELKL